MSILGYDCDGKPIRAGDKVRFIGSRPSSEDMIGVVVTAKSAKTKPCKRDGKITNYIKGEEFTDQFFEDAALKKLDQDRPTIPWSECVWKPKAVTA